MASVLVASTPSIVEAVEGVGVPGGWKCCECSRRFRTAIPRPFGGTLRLFLGRYLEKALAAEMRHRTRSASLQAAHGEEMVRAVDLGGHGGPGWHRKPKLVEATLHRGDGHERP
jgi:hypothetical protein